MQRFNLCKRRLLIQGFDEINARLDALYQDLEEDNLTAFKKLYGGQYDAWEAYLKRDDTVDVMVEIELLLSEPNDTTHYCYDTEVLRKRDRAKEAVISARGKTNKLNELDKALRLWSQQTDQYCDILADAAAIKAFKNAGVKLVVWHTQRDDKVCSECKPRDGVVYKITQIPAKHWRCRCFLTPYQKSS